MEVQLDMYQTLAASVLVLMLGSYLNNRYMYWKNSVFRRGRRGTAIWQSSHVSVTAVDLGDLFWMIP